MIKAIFLDFYGTVVSEDNEVIQTIIERIMKTGSSEKISDIGAYWWNTFQEMFLHSYGDTFKTQRKLETDSLTETIRHFHSTENADELSNLLFEYWVEPPIFEDSKEFFKNCPVPIYIVSNIDTNDIQQALNFHNLKTADVITSEEAHSYKPRKAIFELALRKAKLPPQEVLHVGDSITSDILGASSLGIPAIWLNRFEKPAPGFSVESVSNLMEIRNTKYFR